MKIVIAVLAASLIFCAISLGATLWLPNLLLQFSNAAAEATAKADYMTMVTNATLLAGVSNGLAALAASYAFCWVSRPKTFQAPLLFGIALAAGYFVNPLNPTHNLILGVTILACSLLGSYLYVPGESGD